MKLQIQANARGDDYAKESALPPEGAAEMPIRYATSHRIINSYWRSKLRCIRIPLMNFGDKGTQLIPHGASTRHDRPVLAVEQTLFFGAYAPRVSVAEEAYGELNPRVGQTRRQVVEPNSWRLAKNSGSFREPSGFGICH